MAIDPITLSLIVGGAAKGISALTQGSANNRRIGAARRSLRDLQSINNRSLSAFDAARNRLDDAPMLDIDDTAFNDVVLQSRQNLSNAGSSRLAAEELMRDSQRQATADAISRARNAGSSVADLLGFTSSVSNDERRAMQNIDTNAMQVREQRRESARARLLNALESKAQFDERSQLAEFNRRSNIFDQGMQMDLSRIDMLRGFTMDEIAQRNAIASGEAARLEGYGNILSDLGSTAFSMGNLQADREMMGFTTQG